MNALTDLAQTYRVLLRDCAYSIRDDKESELTSQHSALRLSARGARRDYGRRYSFHQGASAGQVNAAVAGSGGPEPLPGRTSSTPGRALRGARPERLQN